MKKCEKIFKFMKDILLGGMVFISAYSADNGPFVIAYYIGYMFFVLLAFEMDYYVKED